MGSEDRLAETAVSVLVDVPALSHPLDYLPPVGSDAAISPGTMVRVPLHGRSVNGWVLGPGTGTSAALQHIKKIKGFGPPPSVLELSEFASWRFAGARAKFLRAASPERNTQSLVSPPTLMATATFDNALLLPPQHSQESHVVVLGATEDPFSLICEVINEVVVSGGQGAILVATPTVAYSERLAARLQRAGVAAIGPGPDQWVKARSGWPVIVGPRSVALAPAPSVAAVVVLDAHEAGLQEEQSPTWSAVTLLEQRAQQARVPCWLITPVPTPALRVGRSVATAASSRGSQAWPKVEVVDLTVTDKRHRLLTEPFIDAARAALAASDDPGTVVCLFHRTGRAKLLACRTCQQLVVCVSCSSSMEDLGGELVCTTCGDRRPLLCTGCGSMALNIVRPGVSRLAEELRALFQTNVDEVTAATSALPITARVVIGTEAVLHRVRKSTLVAVLDLDQYLLAPRMRSEEATMEMLVRCSRLVGARDQGRGTLLLQTRQVDHEVVDALRKGEVDGLMGALNERRQRLLQPPFTAYARLKGIDAWSYGEVVAAASGLTFVELAEERGLLIGGTTEALCDALTATPKERRKVTISVDPEDL